MILQILSSTVTPNASSTPNTSSEILSWVSIIVTLFLGLIAVLQAFHYYKLSKKYNENIESSVSNINNAVTKLEANNKLMTDQVMGLFGKTIGKLGKTNSDGSMKKDLEKAITDSSDKLEGRVNHVKETIDRQGKENQVGMNNLESQFMILSEGVQKLFKIVLKQLEPEITEGELRNHILEKIGHLTDTLTFCSFKGLTEVIAHQDISFNKIMDELKKMKAEGLILYEGDEIYNDTVIKIIKNTVGTVSRQ